MRNLLFLTLLMACNVAPQPQRPTTAPAPEPATPASAPAPAASSPTVATPAPTPPVPVAATPAATDPVPQAAPTIRPTPVAVTPAPAPAATIATPVSSTSTATRGPDVLVLGDSQISFGAGAVYLDFFEDLPSHCAAAGHQPSQFSALGQRQTAAIGVRSTSLASWTATDGAAKGTICDVDEKFGVNAGAYGIQGNDNRAFIQIGRGDDYQFCEPNQSPFEAAFAPGNYDPKLLVLTFLGNSAGRWANNPTATAQDVQRTISQIPSDIPCVFLTSVPVFLEDTNDERMRAQTAIVNAFERSAGHCEVVSGFTQGTRAAIEGQPQFFRQNDAGEVSDPHHPRPAATRLFLDEITPALCEAVVTAVGN